MFQTSKYGVLNVTTEVGKMVTISGGDPKRVVSNTAYLQPPTHFRPSIHLTNQYSSSAQERQGGI